MATTYLVNNTNDSGAGSLRQAILDANAKKAEGVIQFKIGSGAQTIKLASQLPTLTGPVSVDGSTQPGFSSEPLIKIEWQGTALPLTALAGATIQALDLSWSGTPTGNGLTVTNSSGLTIKNLKIANRRNGIYVDRCSDVRVLDNDLTKSGFQGDNFAIYLTRIQAEKLAGGLEVKGNRFGESAGGLLLNEVEDLTISDGSVAGSQIILEDTCGLTGLTGEWDVLDLRNLTNVTIAGIDLSYSGDKPSGVGLRVTTGTDVTIKNIKSSNRNWGIYVNNVTDVHVLDNDLTKSGHRGDQFALGLAGIRGDRLVGGVEVRGNRFGDSSGGLFLVDLLDLTISDGSAPGSNIILKDTDGLAGLSGQWDVLDFRNLTNATVEGIDLSYPGERPIGIGLRVTGGSNITLRNLKIANHLWGIYASGVKDIRVLDNDLRNCGHQGDQFALGLLTIRGETLVGGVEVRGNRFGQCSGGLFLNDLQGLTISNGSVADSQIILEDTSGLKDLSGQWDVLDFRNLKNATIAEIDLSYPGEDPLGVGLRLTGGSNITVRNMKIANHYWGIYVAGAKDVRVLDNDLTNCGHRGDQFALGFSNVQEENLPGGVEVRGNTFGKSSGGLFLDKMKDLKISDGSVADSNIILKDTDGLAGLSGQWDVLDFRNLTNVTIAGLDLSYPGNEPIGIGLRITGGSNITIRNIKVSNHYWGIYVNGAKDVRVLDNDLTKSGHRGDQFALGLIRVRGENLAGGVEVRGNRFGESSGGLFLDNLADLTISDGSVADSNIVLEDTCGLTDLTGQWDTLDFRNLKNVTVDGVDVSYSGEDPIGIGLRLTGGSNITIRNVKSSNHLWGIFASGVRDLRVLDNDLTKSGHRGDQFALGLDRIGGDKLPGGVEVRGNRFGDSSGGLFLQNMKDLTISDGSVFGSNIVLEDTSGLAGLTGQWDVLDFRNLTNVTIEGLDLSLAAEDPLGVGLRITGGSNITLRKLRAANRQIGIWIDGTRDVRVLENEFTKCGFGGNRSALGLRNIQVGSLPGGVEVRGNRFHGGDLGVFLENIAVLTISDGSVTGSNVVLEELEGFAAPIGIWGAWDLKNFKYVAIGYLDLSFSGDAAPKIGLRVNGQSAGRALRHLFGGAGGAKTTF